MEIGVLDLMSELDKKPRTICVLTYERVPQEDGSIIIEKKELDNREVIKLFADIYGTRII